MVDGPVVTSGGSGPNDPPPETLVSKLDASDPLYLHPSDSSNLTIVSIKLKGSENYTVWANAMQLALQVKNKWGFIDKSCIKSENNDVLSRQWDRCNSIVLTWILNSISEDLYMGQVFSKLACDVWTDLKETYNKIDGSVVFDLYQKINSFSQNGSSVSEYYHKLNIMWRQLDQILQLPACSCDAAKEFNNFNHMIKLMQFLMGLDSMYQGVRTNLLMKETLPTIKEAFAIVSREESHRNYSSGNKRNQSLAFVSKVNQPVEFKRTNKVSNQNLKCTHCNKIGHSVDKCFEIIGYPSWLKPRGSQGKRAIASSDNTVNSCEATVNTLTSDQISRLLSLLNDKSSEGRQSCNVSGYCHTVFCFANCLDNWDKVGWIVDSGANQHMVKDESGLVDSVNVSEFNIKIKHPNGTSALVTKIGNLKLANNVVLKDVFVVPEYNINLISVHKLAKDNKVRVVFDENTCFVQDLLTRKVLVTGRQVDGLYFCGNLCVSNKVCYNSNSVSSLWHARFGHPSDNALNVLKNKLNVKIDGTKPCEVCQRAKQHREPFPLSNHSTTELGELVHLDVWGPYKVRSKEGFRYFLTIVDDYSRAVWVSLMKSKQEVYENVFEFVNIIKTQFKKDVKCLRSDNGTEFVNNQMNSFCKGKGIVHQTSCTYTPQQNGVVERKHRHLLNVARALLFQSGLPVSFWSDCILTAAYLINRTPSSVIGGRTPYELVYRFEPVLDHLRVFGCLGFCTVLNEHDKLSSRAEKSVFIGYSIEKKGYKMFSLDSKTEFFSRDVKFFESVIPFKDKNILNSVNKNSNFDVTNLNFFDMYDIPENQTVEAPCDEIKDQNYKVSGTHGSQESMLGSTSTTGEVQHEQPGTSSTNIDQTEDVMTDDAEGHNSEGLYSDQLEVQPTPRRSTRSSTLPRNLSDYVVEGKVKYGLEKVVNYSNLSVEHKCFTSLLDKSCEPRNFYEASKDPNWVSAMNEEIEALHRNDTWDLVELPPGRSVIGCKWVYKIKYKSTGEIERFKARLVAKGFSQKQGIDFDETFSPVVKLVTVRCIISIAVDKGWSLYQLDVNNAFLYGELNEDVYMSLPDGYFPHEEHRVCKLKRSLYGLKQAPRMWNERLVNVLFELGFKQSKCDYSLFYKINKDVIIYLLVYVDDIVVTGNCLSEINKVKNSLKTKFLIKDLGELKYFLGIEVIKEKDNICLSQRKYCLELLIEYGMSGCKPVSTPIEQNYLVNALCKGNGELLDDITGYQRLVGKLIYLAHTRPDISYTVHFLSQYMHSPTNGHLKVAFRLLRYLKQSPGRGVLFSKGSHFDLIAYADSDWAKCLETRKSITGYCVFLGNSMVSWRSKKQTTVSRSSAEAEYRSMCAVACEVVWIKNILSELDINVNLPVKLFCDNTAALSIAANPVFHDRTKHFEIDLFFLRDLISKGIIKTLGIGSKQQLADLMTKGLLVGQHDELCKNINMHDSFKY
ncbi:putative RNA-directed DNA polymerase [Helianthus debilis subsp. tardiflorus]